jgi:hypothetical protein
VKPAPAADDTPQRRERSEGRDPPDIRKEKREKRKEKREPHAPLHGGLLSFLFSRFSFSSSVKGVGGGGSLFSFLFSLF